MKIEKSTYQGYLWYSNEKQPQVFDNEAFELEIADDANPFIIEGQLYDGKKSVSIKYVDGKYIVKSYETDSLTGEFQEQVFHSHRMDGKRLKFKQFWKEQPDDLCEGMKVLQPAELVFVGFDNSNKEE